MIILRNRLLKLHNSFSSMIFDNTFSKIISWNRYNVGSCRATLFASGLIFSHKLVEIAVLAMLITYFTDDSNKYHLGKAAAFVNIQKGLSALVENFMSFFSIDAYFSHRKIIIHSTVYYIIGLLLLCLTSLKIFPESKIDIFNLMGVTILTVGRTGLEFSLKEFIGDQLRAHEAKSFVNEDRVTARENMRWTIALIFSLVFSIKVVNSTWPIKFIVTTLVMGIALILFLCGVPFYHNKDQLASVYDGSSPSTTLRVVKASNDHFFLLIILWKRQLRLPPQVKFLRRLDKAAVIKSTPEQDEQEKGGRLFSVTLVKECKMFFKMVPIWIAFPVYGLLLSTGGTFFSEQAGNNLSTPLSISFILVLGWMGLSVSKLLQKWVPKDKWKQAKIVGIWAGMVVSTFCFSFAWRIEARRRQIVEMRGLLDKPEETIPMSILWLAPQYCLLGLSKGLVKDGFEDFMIDQLPHSWENYVSAINGFIIDGIGSFLSIVCIYGNRSLFSTTLNHSRLDKYYKRLTILSFVNLCYYWFISTHYTRSDNTHAGEVDDESQSTIIANVV